MYEEYEKQIKMTYLEQCRYLQNKYGFAICNYFPNEECRKKSNKITRSAEGLFCHHLYEHIGSNLGQPVMARKYPFEYQLKENLVYCNYLEHLILHLKINVMSCSKFEYISDIKKFFNSLGFWWIATDINDLYKYKGSTQKWRNNCYEVIQDDYDDYVSILKSILCFIDDNYVGERKIDIELGKQLNLQIIDITEKPDEHQIRGHQCKYISINQEIIDINRTEDSVTVKLDIVPDNLFAFLLDDSDLIIHDKSVKDRSILKYRYSGLAERYNFEYRKKCIIQNFCSLSDKTIWEELRRDLECEYTLIEKNMSKWLKESI